MTSGHAHTPGASSGPSTTRTASTRTAGARTVGARERLLDAAVTLVREQGFTATTVDELCAAAGVTKGAFFHHFPSKEALGVAAAEHWTTTTGALFAAADYHSRPTALERVHGYLDLRRAMVEGPAAGYSCLAGTMVQEVFDSSPTIRDACADAILGHADTLRADLAEALADAGADADLAPGLARLTQIVLQGAFVVAKAADDPAIVHDAIEHLRRYVDCVAGADHQHTAPETSRR